MPSHKYKAILDTNILVSGVLTAGASFDLLALWKKGNFDVVVCAEILEEYFAVLSREKFRLPVSLVKTILDEFGQRGVWVVKASKLNIIEADPDDNKFIEAAVDGKADCIVSRDKHLLEIAKFNDIHIVLPEDFVNLLKR